MTNMTFTNEAGYGYITFQDYSRPDYRYRDCLIESDGTFFSLISGSGLVKTFMVSDIQSFVHTPGEMGEA